MCGGPPECDVGFDMKIAFVLAFIMPKIITWSVCSSCSLEMEKQTIIGSIKLMGPNVFPKYFSILVGDQ